MMMDAKAKIEDKVKPDEYKEGQLVRLVIKAETDLGFKVIVDQKYWAVLYYNEVFQRLEKDQEIEGFIKKIREDLKLDVSLYPPGNFGSPVIGDMILDYLAAAGGKADLTDKTTPEEIYKIFGVSKKKYKMALGSLYKARKILVTETGIELVKKK